MSILFLLIPLSVLVAAGFLAAFIWAVRTGQYEDTDTPRLRVLMDDPGASTRQISQNQQTGNHERKKPS